MDIKIISIAGSRPKWASSCIDNYKKRFDKTINIDFVSLAPERRTNKINSISKLMQREGAKLIDNTKLKGVNIALDRRGMNWSTDDLYKHFIEWQGRVSTLNFLIGGADGLSEEVMEKSIKVWSLSSLTLPHAFVPLIILEQIYRVWSISKNHPYHR